MKLVFFNGQPKPWWLQFFKAPGAPCPEQMTVEQLKEHFKLKEDDAAWKEAKHAKSQQQKSKQSAENQGKARAKTRTKEARKEKVRIWWWQAESQTTSYTG